MYQVTNDKNYKTLPLLLIIYIFKGNVTLKKKLTPLSLFLKPSHHFPSPKTTTIKYLYVPSPICVFMST